MQYYLSYTLVNCILRFYVTALAYSLLFLISGTITARDFPPPTGINALTMLENNVYGGQLQITIPGPGTLEVCPNSISSMSGMILDKRQHTNEYDQKMPQ